MDSIKQQQEQQQQPSQQQQQQQAPNVQEKPTKTLFIAEIPQDITEEDLYNVFCKEIGFLGSRIRQDRKQRYIKSKRTEKKLIKRSMY